MNNPFVIGLIRGVGYPALSMLLLYLSNANNWAGLGISLTMAALLAGVAGGLDHLIEANTGKAVFGSIRVG